MHIDVVPNRNSRPAYLLRESYREGKKVRKRTLANLSALSDEQLTAIRAILQGQQLRPVDELFEVIGSRPQGHVEAVRVAMSKLGFQALLGARPCRERERVAAMVAARILAPHTKLATTGWWQTTTLPEDFRVADAGEDELYAAMDWLLKRQPAIEKKLATRHLESGGLVLYDLSSSYFEGTRCPLARLGYNRDGNKGKLQVNYGLLNDPRGCPVAVSVHECNMADSETLLPAIDRLRDRFDLKRLVMVGDRGMISSKAIDVLRDEPGVYWISALKSASIRSLIKQGHLQLDLFDERNLFELAHPDYPGERLVACRNPQLARRRAHKREALLEATENNLEKVRAAVAAGRLKAQDKIGVRVGRVVNQYKVAKHFTLDIGDTAFRFRRNAGSIAAEAALDGLCVVRSSVPSDDMDSAECVRRYKSMAQVERAFRTLKTVNLKIRPIHHRQADRVRAHILLCMLAYYVEWQMREAWRPLLFADDDPQAKQTRDPVAPARRSRGAERKASTHTLDKGQPAQSFATLIAELSTVVRNTCRTPSSKPDTATFKVMTTPNDLQHRALELIQKITV